MSPTGSTLVWIQSSRITRQLQGSQIFSCSSLYLLLEGLSYGTLIVGCDLRWTHYSFTIHLHMMNYLQSV